MNGRARWLLSALLATALRLAAAAKQQPHLCYLSNGTRVLAEHDLPISVQVSERLQAQLEIHVLAQCGDTWELINANLSENHTQECHEIGSFSAVKVLRSCIKGELVINADFTTRTNSSKEVVVIDVVANPAAALQLALSCISASSILVMVFCYYRYPQLRSFPAPIILWRSYSALLFCLVHIVVNGFATSERDEFSVCNPLLAFLTQLALWGSLSWYVVLCLNFYLSLVNPFRRPSSRMKQYHIGVWSLGLITASVAAKEYGFRSNFGLCWVRTLSNRVNPYTWICYNFWLILSATVTAYCLALGFFRLKNSKVKDTLQKRQESVQQTIVYVIVFTGFWIAAAAMWADVSLSFDKPAKDGLVYLFALLSGMMGFIDSATWFFVQRHKLFVIWRPWCQEKCLRSRAGVDYIEEALDDMADRKQNELHHDEKEKEEDETLPHQRVQFDDIADAVRYEFIHHTVGGIVRLASEIDRESLRGRESGDPSVSSLIDGRAGVGGVDDALLVNVERVPSWSRTRSERLDPTQNIQVNVEEGIRFASYCPKLFFELRELFGVPTRAFVAAMSGDLAEMQKNFSEGKSGSFFFFSPDRRFMVKTLTPDEFDTLIHILPAYWIHMRDNPQSLICRFFGLYSLTLYGSTQHVVVMNNVHWGPEGYRLHTRFDLKGSKVNRYGEGRSLKDNDLQFHFRVSESAARNIIVQCALDARFLRSCNIMDYSLLVGVHDVEIRHDWSRKEYPHIYDENDDETRSIERSGSATLRHAHISSVSGVYSRGVPATNIVGPGVFHFGIVDVLQRWNWTKRFEQVFKIIFRCHCADYLELSAVEPEFYATRFLKMVRRVFNDKE